MAVNQEKEICVIDLDVDTGNSDFYAQLSNYDNSFDLSYKWANGKWVSIRIDRRDDPKKIAWQLEGLAAIISGKVNTDQPDDDKFVYIDIGYLNGRMA